MDDSTANIIVFLAFIVIMIYEFIKISRKSDDELSESVRKDKEETSEAIKRGIRNSKIHGTKKSRRFTDY